MIPQSLKPESPPAEECDNCFYNLAGNTSGRCPECGEACDPLTRSTSQIPWPQRRQRGWIRCFAGTVSLVLRDPRRFAAEAYKPTELRAIDSRQFKRICIAITALVFGVGILSLGLSNSDPWHIARHDPPWFQNTRYAAASIGMAAILLSLAVRLTTWSWKRGTPLACSRQRVKIIADYASAHMVLSTGAVAAAAIAYTAARRLFDRNSSIQESIAQGYVVGALIGAALFWLGNVRLTRYLARNRHPLRVLEYFLAFPFAWIVAAAIYLWIIFWVAGLLIDLIRVWLPSLADY